MKKKIEYDLWANQQILAALQKLPDSSERQECIRLFAHLFKAQIIWYNRIYQINDRVEIWGDYTIEECASLLNDSIDMLEGIAAKNNEECAYTNTKGKAFNQSIADIFEHVIIHGEHHRAQFLQLIRQNGTKPPTTDYIFYLRTL